MSHQTERKEKDCLNCGTIVQGRYCHICGQENIVTRESFWSIGRHFVYDIFHFDGTFYYTLKRIFTRPGTVARQYCEGKRASYLHPIRMYLFTSAVFFLLFFALKTNELQIKETPLSKEGRKELIADLTRELAKDPADSLIPHQLSLLRDTSKEVYLSQLDTSKKIRLFLGNSAKYNSAAHYDSVQKALPKKERDGWFQRKMTKRGLELNSKYKDDMRQGINILWSDFLHKLPYMLFVSLPFFALILKLLYVRRKNFYYSDHVVFTLYHYILSFIVLLLTMLIAEIQTRTGIGDLDWIILALSLTWIGYLFVEMKNFYRQGWMKTLAKFLLLNFIGLILVIILFIAFLLLSVFEI